MHRSKGELGEVLTLQVAVGQRVYGHFDHDAHGMTGPMAKPKNKPGVQNSQEMRQLGAEVSVRRNPRTGELLIL